MTSDSKDPVVRFFGSLLIAFGVLMVLLCGGCGVIFLGFFLISGISQPDAFGMAFIPLVVGGVPTLIGFGLYKAGISLRSSRSGRERLREKRSTDDSGAPPSAPDA